MMIHDSLQSFLRDGREALAKGPVALILAEDGVELGSTLRHHLELGFKSLILFADPALSVPSSGDSRIVRVSADLAQESALTGIVNGIIPVAPPGTWLYYGYNAEYLFFPFCEHRSVGEMAAFQVDERRDAVLSYVIDLYADDLTACPDAVSIDRAHLDKTGYYALARTDQWNNPLERQLDFFGGLRWRFEEHVPPRRRRIDRIALFRTKADLILRDDRTFSDPEYNTYACPWHNSLTSAVLSFRTAKALKRNPGSARAISTFKWQNSVPFSWHSQQLLDLGLIEPGQWF